MNTTNAPVLSYAAPDPSARPRPVRNVLAWIVLVLNVFGVIAAVTLLVQIPGDRGWDRLADAILSAILLGAVLLLSLIPTLVLARGSWLPPWRRRLMRITAALSSIGALVALVLSFA